MPVSTSRKWKLRNAFQGLLLTQLAIFRRLEDRRIHMDLQNFNIHVPEAKRKKMTYPTKGPSLYPVALVVGQFAEHYKTYSPLELQCYPINTALTNPDDLMKRLLEEKMQKEQMEKVAADAEQEVAAVEESVESSSDNSSSDGSGDSDDDDDDDLDSVVKFNWILFKMEIL